MHRRIPRRMCDMCRALTIPGISFSHFFATTLRRIVCALRVTLRHTDYRENTIANAIIKRQITNGSVCDYYFVLSRRMPVQARIATKNREKCISANINMTHLLIAWRLVLQCTKRFRSKTMLQKHDVVSLRLIRINYIKIIKSNKMYCFYSII